MTSKIIILAQGEGTRWKNTANKEFKHLLPVGDETIITRTIRQITETIPYVVICTTRLHSLSETKFPFYELQGETGTTPEGILKTYDAGLWEDASRVIVLFGDVVYSNNAIRMIMNDVNPVSIYGRLEGNKFTGKHDYVLPGGDSELFGFSMYRSMWEDVIHSFRDIIALRKLTRKTTRLWDIYHTHPPYLPKGLVQFGDYTDDVDNPTDYEKFYPKLVQCALEDDKNEGSCNSQDI